MVWLVYKNLQSVKSLLIWYKEEFMVGTTLGENAIENSNLKFYFEKSNVKLIIKNWVCHISKSLWTYLIPLF